MPAWLKLLTGLAATALLARAAWFFEGSTLLADLGGRAAIVMLRHGVTDGSIGWANDDGWISRTARLHGTATPATRAAITAEVARLPGIHSVAWQTPQ